MEKQYEITLMLHTYMQSGAQPENWQFTLSAERTSERESAAREAEETVHQYFQRFQGCELQSMPPFDTTCATPQSMAEYFWQPLCELFAEQEGRLLSLTVEQSDGTIYTRRINSLVCAKPSLPVARQTAQPQPQRNEHRVLQWVLAIVAVLLGAGGVILWLLQTGAEPAGQHIWEYLYQGDFTGTHPTYFSLFSSPAPLPYGVYTVLLALTHHVVGSYFALLGVLYLAGMIGWMRWSKGKNGILLSALLGVAWFVSPPMLHILFEQGNVAMAFCLSGVPYLLYEIHACLEEGRYSAFYGIAGIVLCMVLSSPAATSVAVMATVVFVLLHGALNLRWKRMAAALAAIGTGILLSCFWLVTAVQNGQSFLTEETMIESLLDAFYPLERGGSGSLYIGIALFGVAIFGSLCCNWRRAAGFWTVAAGVVLLVLFHKSLLLMIGMMVALGLVSAGLLCWRSVPKWGLVVCALLLLSDGVFAYYGTQPIVGVQQTIALPQEMQQQWVSALGNVMPENETRVIQKHCMSDIQRRHLEEAFEAGYYTYVFDRSLECGASVVITETAKVPQERREKLLEAAKKNGYRYQENGDQTVDVFWRQTPEMFGTKPTYRSLGIGTTAYYATWLFPDMQEGDSPYPEDYSAEELSQYQTIYLSGWKVRDVKAAEAVLQAAAESQVRIVAEAGTGEALFDVLTEEFVITGSMPALVGSAEVAEQPLDMMAHGVVLKEPAETYIRGVKNAREEAVVGTYGPICYVGLQLPGLTAKESRTAYVPVLETIFAQQADNAPQRDVVEVHYSRGRGTVMIHAAQPQTVLPMMDTETAQTAMGETNKVHGLRQMQTDFLVLQPSYSPIGGLCTGCGVLAAICYMLMVKRREKRLANPTVYVDGKPIA